MPPRGNDYSSRHYCEYFENGFGEKAIFVHDRATRKSMLYIGEEGQATPYAVVRGEVHGLILGPDESAWLASCWNASTGSEG